MSSDLPDELTPQGIVCGPSQAQNHTSEPRILDIEVDVINGKRDLGKDFVPHVPSKGYFSASKCEP